MDYAGSRSCFGLLELEKVWAPRLQCNWVPGPVCSIVRSGLSLSWKELFRRTSVLLSTMAFLVGGSRSDPEGQIAERKPCQSSFS